MDGSTVRGPLEVESLPRMFQRSVKAHPDKTALIIEKGGVKQEYTYEELQVQVGSLARALIDIGIKPGDKVTFKVRSFRTKEGSEVWDFGDGTPKVTVQSDGNAQVHNPKGYAVTKHRYKRPGHYIATVERSNGRGHRAVTHLHIRVGIGD